MELTARQRDIQDAVAIAFQKASEDEDFKAKFLNEPCTVLQEFTGFKVAEPEVIEVVKRNYHIDKSVEGELTDSQLESIAGGNDLQKSWDHLVSYVGSWF